MKKTEINIKLTALKMTPAHQEAGYELRQPITSMFF